MNEIYQKRSCNCRTKINGYDKLYAIRKEERKERRRKKRGRKKLSDDRRNEFKRLHLHESFAVYFINNPFK